MYYIIINGQQQGPLPKEQLVANGVTPDTYVWREGLETWVKVSQLPELADIFYAQPAQQPYSQPYAQPAQQPYAQPAQFGFPGAPIPHTNWMPWAILATVLGCCSGCIGLVLGIIAIVKANQANQAYMQGNQVAGDSANSTAKLMVIITLVLFVLNIIATIGLFATGYFDQVTAILESSGAY